MGKRYEKRRRFIGGAMERFSGFLGLAAFILFMGVGLVQLAAIYSFLSDIWGWYGIFAGAVALALSYIPIIGSICGILAAHDIWHWPWWQAVLLFCWPAVAFLGSILLNLPSPFGKKPQRPVTAPKESPAQTIDIGPAPVEPAPQQEFALEQNPEPPSPQEALQEQAPGKSPAPARTGFFYNLRMGNFSLSQTFWLYGFLCLSLYNMFMRLLLTPEFAQSILYHFGDWGIYIIFGGLELLEIAYAINVYIGIWRAADKYKGKVIWRRLAKVMVCIWWCSLALGVGQELVFFLK